MSVYDGGNVGTRQMMSCSCQLHITEGSFPKKSIVSYCLIVWLFKLSFLSYPRFSWAPTRPLEIIIFISFSNIHGKITKNVVKQSFTAELMAKVLSAMDGVTDVSL